MNFDSITDEPTIFCIGEGCTAISPSSHGHLCASRFMVPLILYWVTESNRHRMLERHPASTISRLTQHIVTPTGFEPVTPTLDVCMRLELIIPNYYYS